MSPSESERRAVARAALDGVRGFMTLPEAASRAASIAADEEGTIEELAAALAADPGLGVHVLKVANSAFYGLRAQVTSIRHATSLLGKRIVRNIALAAGLGPLLRTPPGYVGFSMRSLWSHSIRVAAAAQRLARELGGEPEVDEVFAAGLLHDLGLVVAVRAFPDGYRSVLARAVPPSALLAVEQEASGTDHQALGEALCEHWSFPAPLRSAAAHHHDPLACEPATRELAALVHVAGGLEGGTEHGHAGAAAAPEVEPAVLELLGLETDLRAAGLAELAAELAAHADEAENAFGPAKLAA